MPRAGDHGPGYTPAFKRRVVQGYRDIKAEGGTNGEILELARAWGIHPRTPAKWAAQDALSRADSAGMGDEPCAAK